MISSGILLIKRAVYGLDAIDCVERVFDGSSHSLGKSADTGGHYFPLKNKQSLINLNPFSSNNFYTRVLYYIIGITDVTMIIFKVFFPSVFLSHIVVTHKIIHNLSEFIILFS